MNFFDRFWSLAGVGAVLAFASQVLVVNGQTAFTVTTAYEDSTCSGVPSHLTFWPTTSCEGLMAEANASCQAIDNSLFAVSSCTTDYEGFASAAFADGNSFVIDRHYSKTGCGTVGLVYAYLADAYCHINPDDSTSFRARIDSTGNLGYSFYRDLGCTDGYVGGGQSKDLMNPMYCFNWFCDVMTSLCSRESCGSPPNGYCSCGISVGGPSGPPQMGKHTAVVLYQESSCASPAVSLKLSSELSCTPQIDHYDPVCVSEGTGYSVTDCTQYYMGGWDDLGIISDAFDDSPYLVVEKYVWCGMVDTVTDAVAYRLDEKCYPDAAGNASHKLTLGSAVTITTYSDAICVDEAATITVKRSVILSGGCVGDLKFVVVNAPSVFATTAVYEDSMCSGTPSQLTFAPGIGCHNSLGLENSTCEAIGNSLFAKSGCTTDYSGFASTEFGSDSPYVIEEAVFMDTSKVGFVTVYAADGKCHADMDGATSFSASIDTDSMLTLATFSDLDCNNGRTSATFTKDTLISPTWTFSDCYSMSKLCALEDCWWWYCSKRVSIGGSNGTPAMGKHTVVILYEDSACSSTPISVKLTRELSCTSQSDHYSPICTSNGTALYTVTDCTQYYTGGWDDIGVIKGAFGSDPYLIVETYLMCGVVDIITDVVVYRLNDDCYPNVEGNGSHRLMLGHSVTITTYSDVNCMNMSSITTVERSMLTTSAAGSCTDSNNKYFIVNAQTAFASQTIYEDSTCSGTPSLVTFSPAVSCQMPSDSATASCAAIGKDLYAVSSCTTDYDGFAASTFGEANPFMIDRFYPASGCATVGYVYAFSADGFCHINPDDSSSFRARIDAEGSLSFVWFRDMKCTDGHVSGGLSYSELVSPRCLPEGCEIMPAMLCSRDSCGSPPYGFCSMMITTAGPKGTTPLQKQASITTYEDEWCYGAAVLMTLSSQPSCTPQVNHYDPICVSDGSAYSVSDCTQYHAGGWDDLGIISDAFGDSAYLVVEKYVWCGLVDTVTDVVVYRLDEKCYPNAAKNESHKLTLGQSLTVTTYSDGNCMAAATEVTVERSTVLSGGCGGGDRKYLLANARTVFRATAVYEDESCSGIPSQMTFVPLLGCHGLASFEDAPCEQLGDSLYSVTGCAYDYSELASTQFGLDNVFVIEEASTKDCGNVDLVTVYSADGMCHTQANGLYSFRASIDVAGTLVLRTYSMLNCDDMNENVVRLTKDELALPMCQYGNCDFTKLLCSYANCWYWWGCSSRLRLGVGASGSSVDYSAVTVFSDDSCTGVPVQIMMKKQPKCVSEDPTCVKKSAGKITTYQAQACIKDVAAFAKSRFNGGSYLIMEKYKDGTNCKTEQRTVVYSADGNCYHSVSDGTSFRLLPSFGGSVMILTYPTTSCNDSDAEVTAVGSKHLNTGTCYNGNMKFYGNVTAAPSPVPSPAPSPAPSVNIDQKTLEEIMFPEWLWQPTPRRIFEDA
jgi:hypothetical protein